MRRVSVIGSSGAGKSTISEQIARAIGGEHIELDAHFHQPNWRPTPTEEFRARIAERLHAERWVVDGNYFAKVQDLVWSAADTIVWIDFPRRRILPRLLRRMLRRMWSGEELWNGNRERFRNLFDPRPEENVVLWMLTTHRQKRRRYEAAFDDPSWSALARHRLRTPEEVQRFRDTLG